MISFTICIKKNPIIRFGRVVKGMAINKLRTDAVDSLLPCNKETVRSALNKYENGNTAEFEISINRLHNG